MTLGQFGSSSDVASNDSTYRTFSLGGSMGLSPRFSLFADATYTVAEQSLDPISMPASPEVLEALHWGQYDFATMHLYSQLDSSSWDATVRAEAKVSSRVTATASYSYLSFDDDAAYLENLTGSLDVFRLGVRWIF